MKHFIIDGYNALFKIKPLIKKQYRSREGFIQFIRITRPFGSIRNKVSLIFDGTKGVAFEQKPSYTPIDVIFSKDGTADDMIVRMAKKEMNKRETTVVTDDRELKEKVKLSGCSTLSVLEFFKQLTAKKTSTEKEKPDPNSKKGKDITEAMRKIWEIE